MIVDRPDEADDTESPDPDDETEPFDVSAYDNTVDIGTAANVGCELESDDDDQTSVGMDDEEDQ